MDVYNKVHGLIVHAILITKRGNNWMYVTVVPVVFIFKDY